MREDGQTDNRVPCRGAMSVSGEERLPAGLAVREGNPGPLQIRWQQEAIPVHLLPPGCLAGPCLAAFCSALGWGRGLTGGRTRGAMMSLPGSSHPPSLCGSVAFRPLPAEPLFSSSLVRSWVERQIIYGNPGFLPKLLLWQAMSWKDISTGELRWGAGFAFIS